MRIAFSFLLYFSFNTIFSQTTIIHSNLDDTTACSGLCIKTSQFDNAFERLYLGKHSPWSPYSPQAYLIKSKKCYSGNFCLSIYNGIQYSYLQSKFQCPLLKDSLYYFEAYVTADSFSNEFSSCLGIKFIDSTIHFQRGNLNSHLKLTADISNKPEDIIYANEWTKVTGYYKAKGNEAAILIGHFGNEGCKTKRNKENKAGNYSTIFLDNIIFKEAFNSKYYCDTLGTPISMTTESAIRKIIYFEFKDSTLSDMNKNILDSLINIINPKQCIELFGHTDNEGSFEYNKKLSEARTGSVLDYLEQVIKNRIMTQSFSYLMPISDNITEESKAKNRRVEIVISNCNE